MSGAVGRDGSQQWKVRSAEVTDGWAVHHLLHVVFRGRDAEKESQGATSEPPSALDDLDPVTQVCIRPFLDPPGRKQRKWGGNDKELLSACGRSGR